jgi:hypothetical protein
MFLKWFNYPVKNKVRIAQLVLCALLTNFASPAQATEKTELNTASVCSGPWGSTTGSFKGPASKVYAPYGVTISKATVSFHSIGMGYNTSRITIYNHNASTNLPGSALGTLVYSSVNGSVATLTGSVTIPSAGNYWVQYNTPTGGYYNCYTNTINFSGSAAGWVLYTGLIYGTAGSGDAATSWAAFGGQSGYQMNFTLYSTVIVDNTPPTFPSLESFNVPENTTSVGTITTSESATVSIFGGEDSSRFSLTRTSDSSTSLRFMSAPNFEAPTDIGANNTYTVVLKAVDGAANTGFETVTATVTDVVDTSVFNSFSLTGTPVFRSSSTINAEISVQAKVTFSADGIRIPGCVSKPTSLTSPFTVSCVWKPSRRGVARLTAIEIPTNNSISGSSASPLVTPVLARTTPR